MYLSKLRQTLRTARCLRDALDNRGRRVVIFALLEYLQPFFPLGFRVWEILAWVVAMAALGRPCEPFRKILRKTADGVLPLTVK